MFVIWFTKVEKLFQFVNFHIKIHTIAAFLASAIFLMPLTTQGDELVHAVGQGGRDESEAGCVTVGF